MHSTTILIKRERCTLSERGMEVMEWEGGKMQWGRVKGKLYLDKDSEWGSLLN